MKLIQLFVVALTALSVVGVSSAKAAVGFKDEKFKKVFYFEYNGKGSQDGLSPGNAKPIADTDLMAIPAGMVIEKVYVIIDTAVAGTTALDIGDDDDADGFVKNAALTLGTPGLYSYNAGVAGDYLRYLTQGASTPNVVAPMAKYYSAAGKEIKMDNTTSNSAGKLRVVVEGLYHSY